jgi:pimeloyl-ACP methyl ester carboxylesterase
MDYVSIGNEKLHYRRIGHGSRILIAFHGYGIDSAMFEPFGRFLQQQYTILAFDLPYHGESNWKSHALLTKKKLANIVATVCATCNVEKISLMGYSIGGRIALAALETAPSQIDNVVLIAPDGLELNYFHYFATRNVIGKQIFRHMLSKPGIYLKVIDGLKKTGLLGGARHRFVTQSVHTHANRMFLLNVWTCFSELVTSPSEIRKIINQYHIPVFIFMGAHDRIIPPSKAQKFKTGMNTVKLCILEKGHHILDEENTGLIARELL